MRYGYWMPVFGSWLRNIENEQMQASWEYTKKLAQRSEEIGFDLSLVAELNLNDIKGVDAPSLDAWSTAAALTAVTNTLELMVAVRPTFHNPALLAKQAANINRIGGGNRLSLNVVSSWWAGEANKYGVQFDEHDDRNARTAEWLEIVNRLWREDHFDFSGDYYKIEDAVMPPKPLKKPEIYAGGESEKAKNTMARLCDAYMMHGDEPAKVQAKIEDMQTRREKLNLPPMIYGVAGYTIVRNSEAEVKKELERITDVKQSATGYENYQDWLANTKLEQQVSLEDYSVSNRGLRSGLTGTPAQVADQVGAFERAGVNLLLLECSPQIEEMERFSEAVI